MSVNIIVSEHISVKGSIVSIRNTELYHLFENCDKCPKETCLSILKLLEDKGVNCVVSDCQVAALKKVLYKISGAAKNECKKGEGRSQIFC